MTKNITTQIWQRGSWLKKALTLRAFSGVALGIIGALVVSVTAFTGTASAAYSDCPDYAPHTTVCMFNDLNYNGPMFWRTDPLADVCYGVPSGFNDTVSSIVNRAGYNLYYYQDAGCSGWLGNLPPFGSTGYVGAGANDKISSWRVSAY